MHHEVEAEFKLRATQDLEVAAVDAAVREAGFVCSDADSGHHVDAYLDDGEGSLRRAGIGLRLRDRNGARELTCKTRGQRNGSLFVRDEWQAPWPPCAAPRTAAELPPALRDAVEPFALDRPLGEVLRLATQRDRRTLQRDGRDLGELAIDHVQATAAGRSASFAEVEIEVQHGLPDCERLADRLTQGLPLQPAGDDKPGHAGALLGLQPAAREARPLHAAMPVGQATATLVQRHLVALQRAEVAVRRDEHSEHLHAMRVATRRLRELVRCFGDLWPRQERTWLLDHLGRTGRQLGTLRDLDVLLQDLPLAIGQLPAALRRASDEVLDWVGRRRRRTREQLLTWLCSAERLADQRRMCETFAAAGSSAEAMQPLAAVLPHRLARTTRKVRKLARAMPADLPFEPLHRLRIACKRLRYLAEAFDTLPGLDYGKSLAAVTRLQQSLGTVCDREVATRRLVEWIPHAAAAIGDQLQVAALLGGLAARAELDAGRTRERAARDLARVDRKRVYRRFEAAAPTDATLAR